MSITTNKKKGTVELYYWKTKESVTLSIEAWEDIIKTYELTKDCDTLHYDEKGNLTGRTINKQLKTTTNRQRQK